MFHRARPGLGRGYQSLTLAGTYQRSLMDDDEVKLGLSERNFRSGKTAKCHNAEITPRMIPYVRLGLLLRYGHGQQSI